MAISSPARRFWRAGTRSFSSLYPLCQILGTEGMNDQAPDDYLIDTGMKETCAVSPGGGTVGWREQSLSRVRKTWVHTWLCYLLAVWPWGINLSTVTQFLHLQNFTILTVIPKISIPRGQNSQASLPHWLSHMKSAEVTMVTNVPGALTHILTSLSAPDRALG